MNALDAAGKALEAIRYDEATKLHSDTDNIGYHSLGAALRGQLAIFERNADPVFSVSLVKARELVKRDCYAQAQCLYCVYCGASMDLSDAHDDDCHYKALQAFCAEHEGL